MEIRFNINESKQIDLKPENENKKKRKNHEDYDFEDSLFEIMEEDENPVELECDISNFFVYAGELKEDPKKILKRYSNYKRKSANDNKTVKKKKANEKDTSTLNDTSVMKSEESKIKCTLRDEYFIKNEIIMRYNRDYDDNMIFEFFNNQLVIEEIKDTKIILNKLNIKKAKLDEKNYLLEKLSELNTKMDISRIKLLEMINDKIMNDNFYETLWEYTDLHIRIFYLNSFISNKKRLTENTVKKNIKSNLKEILSDKNEDYKNWGVKLHYYKKKHFFDKYSHLLGCSLQKSELSGLDLTVNDSIIN